jgi:putative hemolysin
MIPSSDPESSRTGTRFAPRELGVGYPSHTEFLPEAGFTAGRYQVRFARSVEDLDQIQRLRFEVFNLELGEGLESAFQMGRDHDDLDPELHHLLIAAAETGEVVGTYRLQTAEMAGRGRGFYSAGEFELTGLPREFLAAAVEVGRACVAKEHRNGRVLNLLWRGLALYMVHNRKRHIFGCCSLTSQDVALGQATLAFLEREGHLHPSLAVRPLAGMGCDGADPVAVAAATVRIPPLFQSYLQLGAKVLGPPVIDREFKTIDFLVALDVAALDEHSYRFFFR